MRHAGEATRVALFFALLTGLLEPALLAIARFGLGRYTQRDPQIVWMASVSYAAIFGILLLPLFLAVRSRDERTAMRASVTTFGFLSAWALLQLVTRLHPAASLVLAAGLAWQAGRMAGSHTRVVSAVARRALLPLSALVVLLGGGLAAWRAITEKRALAALPAVSPGAPNVLLVILDTVRSLDMSLYGYNRPTTPQLALFARKGVTFEHAITPAPWTLPAHASIFTGRWAHEISAGWRSPLDNEAPTLAEALAASGYRTGGFVANYYYTTRESGLARGFAHYEDFRVTPSHVLSNSALGRFLVGNHALRALFEAKEDLVSRKTGDMVVRDFLRWQSLESERPFFAFLNLYDAHNPYLPPPPYDTLFARRGAPRNLRLANERPVTREQAQGERDVYDGAIAYLDVALGALLDTLAQRGVLERTVVIITSDHGEEFGEHGLLSHGNSLYYQALAVPLIIVYPARVPEAVRIPGAVSTRDLAATVLDLVGGASALRLPGKTLARHWRESNSEMSNDTALANAKYASNLPAWFPISKGDMRSLMIGTTHVIRDGAGRLEAYDIATDREEVSDLARDPARRDATTRLGAMLEAPARSPRPTLEDTLLSPR